jgi:hypothetical protein
VLSGRVSATSWSLVQRSPTVFGMWSKNFNNEAALACVGPLRQRERERRILVLYRKVLIIF